MMTREEFRNAVFVRDHHKCVVCGEKGRDAHHIVERRLFPDGGYDIDNGATLCAVHHLESEMTHLSCNTLRNLIQASRIVLPPSFYPDCEYDKWGNIILSNGQRMRGPLFYDESVQKILAAAELLGTFTRYVKYPRTWHLPWSPGIGGDDRVMDSTNQFDRQRVIVTEKMDGENTTIYADHIHARSIDMDRHPSRSWVKNLQARLSIDIPDGWRICGENVFAKHSIRYDNLESYFLGFSIWDDQNSCLDWDSTVEWFGLMGIICVPVIIDEIWSEEKQEGYVVRTASGFSYGGFPVHVGKYVRAGHVATTHHWKMQLMIQNTLCKRGRA